MFDGFQHIADIRIVQIKGGAVDIHRFDQFFHGNVIDIFFFHQAGQSGTELGFGFPDTPVGAFFHREHFLTFELMDNFIENVENTTEQRNCSV